MKSLGYALLISGLVGGAYLLTKVISQKSAQECARQCPENEAALRTAFQIGPLALQLCNCGAVPSKRGDL